MPTSFASIWQVLFRLIVFEIRSSTINRFGAISGSTHWSREENRAQGYAAQSPKIYSSGDQRKPLVRFIATNPALSSQASVPSAFFRLDVFQPAPERIRFLRPCGKIGQASCRDRMCPDV